MVARGRPDGGPTPLPVLSAGPDLARLQLPHVLQSSSRDNTFFAYFYVNKAKKVKTGRKAQHEVFIQKVCSKQGVVVANNQVGR
jgi:hypothetical protein